METFTKMACGCYVGFDVNHKPMWGKQCPLHDSAPKMYKVLKDIAEMKVLPVSYIQIARNIVAQAEGKE